MIEKKALDVTTPEPLPSEHKLYELDNCIVTPHIAWDEEGTRIEAFISTALNVIHGLIGRKLIYEL